MVKLKLPILIVNFKAYKQATGKKGVKLAKICEKVAKNSQKSIIVAVQTADINAIAKAVSIPVLAQHVDPVSFGRHTGAVLPESVKQAGSVGSLLNHSEKPISLKTIKESVKRLHELSMNAIVCASTPALAVKIAKFKPDIIAIEPPELIAGKIAVSQAKPEVIKKTTSKIKIPVICGAGVHAAQDVAKAKILGAKGVLIASSVVKARNPEKVLKELVKNL